MSKKTKVWVGVLGLGTVLTCWDASAAVGGAGALRSQNEKPAVTGEVLFKIHDIVPEKDANGKVLYCNVGATFFNHTNVDISNAAVTLSWNDDVIEDIINQEERADKEAVRSNPEAERPRYSTAGFTGRQVSSALKLPPLKSNQQVVLKTKVDTDRCFLLLKDMNVTVNNCGTFGMSERGGLGSRGGCDNLFRYVSPKEADYYMEFKEASFDEQVAEANAAFDKVRKEVDAVLDETINVIRDINTEESKDKDSKSEKDN